MKHLIPGGIGLIIFVLVAASLARAEGKYENFRVAVYTRAQEVREMADPAWLESRWNEISSQLKVDKIYLETHRDVIVVDDETIEAAKKFFADRGIETAGGITLTIAEGNRFQTFCYSNPNEREEVRRIVEHTARHFDEIILDDFFFTNCKCEACIAAKGDRSWTRFRLDLLEEASRELIIGPAKKVNPNVKMVIKYPNWYEHFQGLGYNLEAQPKLFDGIYTGTETRDPFFTHQHLQPYQSYLICRYFENIKPGGNGGGWVDPASRVTMDRYAEQLFLTAIAKMPEITLFDFRQLVRPLVETDRAEWQGQGTSFDFDAMTARLNGSQDKIPRTALAAGYALEQADKVVGKLGNPVGVVSYKPYHSTGDDFLHNYLGMIGIPMDLAPEFPAEEPLVFLAESAKFDPEIVARIKRQLVDGKTVVITSGLLRALQGHGIEDIVELEATDKKVLTDRFMIGRGAVVNSSEPILLPQIKYLTNDSWEEITLLADANGFPLLHSADYATGKLYVLAVPDNFADLYKLPPAVLGRIREVFAKGFDVRLAGPSQVSIFVYDNDTFVVESFRDEDVAVRLITPESTRQLRDVMTGEILEGQQRRNEGLRGRPSGDPQTTFRLELKPHSYRVFAVEPN